MNRGLWVSLVAAVERQLAPTFPHEVFEAAESDDLFEGLMYGLGARLYPERFRGFEEWWVSETKYRLSYSSPSFHQIDYSNENGLFRVGSAEWPDEATGWVSKAFYPSIALDGAMAKYKVRMKDATVEGTALKCIMVETGLSSRNPPVEIHYLGKDAPIQRIGVTSRGIYQTFYNQISMFRGIYLARDTRVSRQNKPLVHVHIDTLESMPKIDEVIVVPPPDAISIARRVFIPVVDLSQSTAKTFASKPQPEYPSDARAARIQGSVVLRSVIGRDGRIVSLEVLSGPPALQQASLNAVRQWRYQPYLLDGEPVEVETQILVVFALSTSVERF